MLQWLRLTIWLLLSAAVSGTKLKCDVVYGYQCWNSQTHDVNKCLTCTIDNQKITDNEVSIAPKRSDGSAYDVELVLFIGGHVTQLPKVINEESSQQYLQVGLEGTKTRVLNAQFFGNASQHLISFQSKRNNELSVAADVFQNCKILKLLGLGNNKISSIPAETFHGLNKLVYLDLRDNELTAINENLFDDLVNLEVLHLSENQLIEVADTAFENLHNLKELHLHSNKIEIVREKMFQNNQQLRIIDLEYNQIKVIESGAFSQLLKLSWLGLFQNNCANDNFINKSPAELSAALAVCHPIDSIEGQLKFSLNQMYLL